MSFICEKTNNQIIFFELLLILFAFDCASFQNHRDTFQTIDQMESLDSHSLLQNICGEDSDYNY